MKATLFLCLVSVLCFGQAPNVNIWQVKPDSVCPGDTIIVNYKLSNVPTPTNNAVVNIFMSPYTLYSGGWVFLKSQPKEKWLNTTDSTYVIKLLAPMSASNSPGMHYVTTPATPLTNSVTQIVVKDCICTLTTSFTYTADGLNVNFASNTPGTNSTTVYSWEFGQGWNVGPAVTSYSFFSPGTYTVGHNVKNKFCEDVVWTPVTVTEKTVSTTGINEYELSQTPIYFDLFGQRTEKVENVILIEQRGTTRKKILINRSE